MKGKKRATSEKGRKAPKKGVKHPGVAIYQSFKVSIGNIIYTPIDYWQSSHPKSKRFPQYFVYRLP